MPFFIEHREGRLVEYAMVGEISDVEMRDFRTQMWALMSRIAGRVVLFVDMTKLELLAPKAEEGLLAMVRGANPKIERTAVLWSRAKAPVVVQMQSVLAAAAESSALAGKVVERRGFGQKDEARRWLDEVLSPPERARLESVIRAI